MEEIPLINKFSIVGLHGHYDLNIEFKNNRLILVGENGTGKTTALKIFYYFVSQQFEKILPYDFTNLKLEFLDESIIQVSKNDLSSNLVKQVFENKRLLMRLSQPIWRDIIRTHRDDSANYNNLVKICQKHDVPMSYIFQFIERHGVEMYSGIEREKLSETHKNLKSIFANISFIYLPTYRRIESEIKDVLTDVDEADIRKVSKYKRTAHKYLQNDSENFMEIVEFGMKDVEAIIDATLQELIESSREKLEKLTFEYLDDIINEEYKGSNSDQIKENDISDLTEFSKNTKTFNESSINKIMAKFKGKSKNTNTHNKIISHYLIKLLKVYRIIKEEETNISKFFEICNKYLSDKEIIYKREDYSYSIQLKIAKNEIDLNDLSSGEKQIVSLFCHLFLTTQTKKKFIIIDEPELSLSVDWQREFLKDISDAEFCVGIFAVTHSPFVFDNELKIYAKGINLFKSEN